MHATLEEVAPVVSEAETGTPAQDATPEPDIITDDDFRADLKRVRELAGRDRAIATHVKLSIGRIVSRRVGINCEKFARSWDERSGIRSQTVKLFAFEFATGMGQDVTGKVDDKELYRLIRGYQLATLVSEETRAALHRLNWDSIRQLVRWVRHDEKEDTYSLGFRLDLGVADAEGRTTREIDATELLAELIPALATAPKSPKSIRAILDAKEAERREAELVFLTTKQRKQATAAKAMADRLAESEKRGKLFDAFAKSIVGAKLSSDVVIEELFRRGIVTSEQTEMDPAALATLSAEEAAIVGKLWVQANNVDAIAALYDVIRPLVTEATTHSQPSRAAGAPLDTLGSTRKIA